MLAEADPANGGHGKEFIAGFEYAGDWQIGDPVTGVDPVLLRRVRHLGPPLRTAPPRRVRPRGRLRTADRARLTEHGGLTAAGFTAGQSVLITGAPAGIGLIGAQIA